MPRSGDEVAASEGFLKQPVGKITNSVARLLKMKNCLA